MNDQEKIAKAFSEVGVEFSEGFKDEFPDMDWHHPVYHNSFISIDAGDDGSKEIWQYFLFLDGKLVSQGIF